MAAAGRALVPVVGLLGTALAVCGCGSKLEGRYQGSLQLSASLNVYPAGIDATKVPPRGVDVEGLSGGKAIVTAAVLTGAGRGRYHLSLHGCELDLIYDEVQRAASVDDAGGGQAGVCQLGWPPTHPEPISLRFAGTAMLDRSSSDRVIIDMNGLSTARHITGGISLVFHGNRVE